MKAKAPGRRTNARVSQVENVGGFCRRTITLPAELEAAIEGVADKQQFSAFATRALMHELQRERIATWLDERQAARGGKPLSSEAVAYAEQTWRGRKK